MRVLIVDDDDSRPVALQRLLKQADTTDIEVASVLNLEQAREVLAARSFDALLLEMSNGAARDDAICGLPPIASVIPVIVVNRDGDTVTPVHEAMAHGAQDFLTASELNPRNLMRSISYSIDRHRARRAALESEELFRLLVESVQDYAIVLLNPAGHLTSWNAGAERIYGYAADEVLGQHVSMFCDREDPAGSLATEYLRRASEDGVFRTETWRMRKDGSRFYAHTTITALAPDGDHPRGFAIVVRDMTAQRRAADDLLAYQERLRRLAAQLNRNEDIERRRLASLLHDGITQALAAAQIQIDTLPESSVAGCGGALFQVRELISEAIDLTRRMTFDLSPPVLYQVGLPAALVALMDQVRRRHGIEAEVHCTGVWTPMMTPEMRGMLYQIIRELVNNVIKHARATRLQVLLFRRNPTPEGTAGSIHVRVIDNGVGFEKSGVPTNGERSEGFGLFNLRERIAQSDGWIRINSPPGQTEVELEVPLEAADASDASHKN